MRAYSIFDDFPQEATALLQEHGISIELLPKGHERPAGGELKELIDKYDILFVSTAQKMTEDMFANITTTKIIGTASSGTDHIHVPEIV